MITVRSLAEHDSVEALTALLHRAYARLGAMGLNYTAVDQTPDVTARRLAGGQCYLAEWAGALAGTIVVKPTYADNECEYFTREGVAAVHQFAVEPSLQGKGIGRRLLSECEAWARAHGFRELAMDTAQPAHHLIHLYGSLGYRHVGHVRWSGKVYRSVVLSKQLSASPPSPGGDPADRCADDQRDENR
jgi:GNAT superfamily N-acetyltransferase